MSAAVGHVAPYVLEKCGFQRERVLRRSILKDGELIDQVLYVRLR